MDRKVTRAGLWAFQIINGDAFQFLAFRFTFPPSSAFGMKCTVIGIFTCSVLMCVFRVTLSVSGLFGCEVK